MDRNRLKKTNISLKENEINVGSIKTNPDPKKLSETIAMIIEKNRELLIKLS